MDTLYDLFSNGLKETIVDPLIEDWKNAYWMQRAARERYPMANAALNFLPTPVGAGIGLAANIDDLFHDTKNQNYSGMAGDLIGAGVGYERSKGAASGAMNTLKDVYKTSPKTVGRGALLLGALPMTYGRSVYKDQQTANQQYNTMSLLEIANKLRQ